MHATVVKRGEKESYVGTSPPMPNLLLNQSPMHHKISYTHQPLMNMRKDQKDIPYFNWNPKFDPISQTKIGIQHNSGLVGSELDWSVKKMG